MRVGNRKPLLPPEQLPAGREERLAEDHRRHGKCPQDLLPIVELLRSTTDRSGEVTLVVERRLAVSVEPCDEPAGRGLDHVGLHRRGASHVLVPGGTAGVRRSAIQQQMKR